MSKDNGKYRALRGDLGVLSYPYVLNGNTIVFSDDDNGAPCQEPHSTMFGTRTKQHSPPQRQARCR